MMHKRASLDDTSIVSYIVRKLGVVKGKKALQKIVYFVESAGAPLSYVFRWWFYGPFSRELDIDINYLIAEDTFDYQISLGSTATLKIKKPKELIEEKLVPDERVKKKIDYILNILKDLTDDFNPLKLELAASIHFIVNNASTQEDKSINKVIEKIRIVKGNKFSKDEIREMYEKLKNSRLMRG
ncbi:MAG: hypothetical protein J7L07_07105 [Candidatus Odinarchaeota archaeon]|nr:hypothetical protein [Candidatus Odinarchaeota archaeon]